MESYYLWILIFAVAAYFIVTDNSIAAAVFYLSKLAYAYIYRQWWWLTHNPRNPVVKYLIHRNSVNLAEKMMEDIKKDKE